MMKEEALTDGSARWLSGRRANLEAFVGAFGAEKRTPRVMVLKGRENPMRGAAACGSGSVSRRFCRTVRWPLGVRGRTDESDAAKAERPGLPGNEAAVGER